MKTKNKTKSNEYNQKLIAIINRTAAKSNLKVELNS